MKPPKIAPIKLRNGRLIGLGHPAYIIAEVGSNHDGSLDKAKKLVRLAKEAGADAVKFQSFQAENLINRRNKSGEQWQSHPSLKILEKLSVPENWHEELAQCAKKAEIDFLSTPFDINRLSLLLKLGVPAIKISSGDLTYNELLVKAGSSGVPIFLSTGAAYIAEVEEALKVLRNAGCEQVVLLHCASLYPPEFQECNIRAMTTMRQDLNVPVGYSDHAPGFIVVLGAVALGACVIEKHFTDDPTLPGPDHPHSLDKELFLKMVIDIRNLEAAMGDGIKQPCFREADERIFARRALYANVAIPKGTAIKREMIKIVRPAYPEGISALYIEAIEGKKAQLNIAKDEILTRENCDFSL